MADWMIFLVCITYFFSAYSQIRYVNADQFPLIGKISDKTETRYERLPATLKDQCRPPLWKLGKNTSGLAIRFCSNSTTISAKWEVLDNTHMDHMTDVGCRPAFTWEGDHWQFVNSASDRKVNENRYRKYDTGEREYLLFCYMMGSFQFHRVDLQPQTTQFDIPKPILLFTVQHAQGGAPHVPVSFQISLLVASIKC